MIVSARAAASRTVQALAWLTVLGAIAVIAAAVVVPRLGGATPYTVRSDSMRPTYPKGTLVVVRPTPVDEIGIGQVVTFQLESGEPTVVTHRVVGISAGLDGGRSLVTQGDANDVADAEPVRPEQVKGTLWYSVPYVGFVNDVIGGDQRRAGTYVVVVALLGYAVLMLVGSARDRRRRPPAEHEQPAEPAEPATTAV